MELSNPSSRENPKLLIKKIKCGKFVTQLVQIKYKFLNQH